MVAELAISGAWSPLSRVQVEGRLPLDLAIFDHEGAHRPGGDAEAAAPSLRLAFIPAAAGTAGDLRRGDDRDPIRFDASQSS
jgi:hypothetical protein